MDMIYFVIKMITIPGTFVKAFCEQFACKIYEIPVEFPTYIQRNQLCGHVEHELAKDKGSFGVCFIPHILTLISGLVTIIPGAIGIIYLSRIDVVSVILLYFGISILSNTFPLMEDATLMWEKLYDKDSNAKQISKIGLFIPAVIMYYGSRLEYLGVTFITSIAFAFCIPQLVALIAA